MVAAIAGHSHRNAIVPRSTLGGRLLADHDRVPDRLPGAGACVQVGGHPGHGGVALETWMIDHGNRHDAGVSRELAFIDAQGGRPRHDAGGRLDRNIRLDR
jgi:hypothetical protein